VSSSHEVTGSQSPGAGAGKRRRAVELVSTGTELLSGRVLNTHARTLATYLAPFGLVLHRDTTVTDEPAAIADAVRGALARVDLLFVSGGLGPTPDDLTRDAVATVLGRLVVSDAAAESHIRERSERRGRRFTPAIARQALVVQGAKVLLNPVGYAPGERLCSGDKTLFVLPGPPTEFAAVMDAHVIPWLEAQTDGAGRLPQHVFLLCGKGESDVVALLKRHRLPPKEVDVAFCASPGQLELRLTGRRHGAAVRSRVEKAADTLRRLLAENVFAEEDTTLPAVIGSLLRAQGKRLAVAESCTGGLLGDRLTSVPGSSEYFQGGLIAYTNDAKIALLGVNPDTLARDGAVSESVAAEMARGARRVFAADFGIGITGIAGPGGGSEQKPVGTVCVALAGQEEALTRRLRLSGTRETVKFSSTQAALHLLRRILSGRPQDRE